MLYIDVPDGLADLVGGINLSSDDGFTIIVHQFLSYGSLEGLVAENGPVAGITSTSVIVSEIPAEGEN